MDDSTQSNLLRYIDDRQDELVYAAQALVQAPSPNPPGDISSVAQVATDLIKKAIPSCVVTTHQTAPGIVNVVAVIQGNALGRRLVFNGHLDTYPYGDQSKWSDSPISGTLSDDGKRMYGRGSSDMKGGIAASIIACAALAEHKESWNGEVILALAGDEETMGTLGSGYLLDNVNAVQCDAMICPDAGSPTVVRIGEKGLVWVEISATGIPAHGAHVHKGINAIQRLLEALTALKGLENLVINCPQEVEDVIMAAKDISEPLGGIGEQDTLRRLTVNIGTIHGGASPNLVPAEARAAADIRLPMGISTEDVIQHLHLALDALQGVSFQVTRQYDPSWTSPSEEIVKLSLEAARSVVSPSAVANMRVGASDARLFRAKGIPTVVVGLTPYNMGGPDEYIMTDELAQVAKIHLLSSWQFLQQRKEI
ncbi:hypothetical protein QQS21_007958 [Conoideocrella luteorostrata]|uniref:Peptidase M20 dimerisation domain-containing protein n=1 Tax=Conoideocrella luteorostrata TaxID=1105319 RepID=A0AAJ0FWX5_9HYPO|nr:hypothetical protein QQS21_007958 [Conoideocrella luteorostrata]